MRQRIYIGLAILGILGFLFFVILWKGLQPKILIYTCDEADAKWTVTVNSVIVSEPVFESGDSCQKTELPRTIFEADITFRREREGGVLESSQHVDFAKTTYIYAHERDNRLWISTSKQFVPSLADR